MRIPFEYAEDPAVGCLDVQLLFLIVQENWKRHWPADLVPGLGVPMTRMGSSRLQRPEGVPNGGLVPVRDGEEGEHG